MNTAISHFDKPQFGFLLLAVTIFVSAGCRQSEQSKSNNGAANATTSNSSATDNATADASSRIHFELIDANTFPDFTYRNGEESNEFTILESLGGGVGVIDIDCDCYPDLILPGGGKIDDDAKTTGLPAACFRNVRGAEFIRCEDEADIDGSRFYSHGVAVGDGNGDGMPDFAITGFGGLQYFVNNGDGTFSEETAAAGIDDRTWSSSAAWADVNGDALPDLFVAHYVDWSYANHPNCPGDGDHPRDICPPRAFNGLPDLLFLNSASGRFQRSPDGFQIRPQGKGLGVLICDINDDQRPDIYVTNDTVPNAVYASTPKNGLNDISLLSGASLNARGVPDGSMGIQLLDFDNDLKPDLWVTNYQRESSALYQCQQPAVFRHISHRVGINKVGAQYVGWGSACFDADHDGDEDTILSNGHVIRFPVSSTLSQPAIVFENLNGETVRNVPDSLGRYGSRPHMARGSAVLDFDRDGDLDLCIMHSNEPVALLRNEINDHQSIQVALIGSESERSAIASSVIASSGEQAWLRQRKAGGSYSSSETAVLHFGLPAACDKVDLKIRWPSQTDQTVDGVAVGSEIVVVEGVDRLFVLPR